MIKITNILPINLNNAPINRIFCRLSMDLLVDIVKSDKHGCKELAKDEIARRTYKKLTNQKVILY